MTSTQPLICDVISQNSKVYPTLSLYKAACRKKKCKFVNKTLKCIADPSQDINIYQILDDSREKDFARTFATEENLKSIKYRLSTRHGIINRDIPFSKENQHVAFQITKHFILDDTPCDFVDIVKTLNYLGSGTYGHAFQLCPEENCQPEFVMKLIPYTPPDVYDSSYNYANLPIINPLRGENVEVLQAVYLEQLLIKNRNNIISPHISLPIIAFRCDYDSDSIRDAMALVKDDNYKAFETTNNKYNGPPNTDKITVGQPVKLHRPNGKYEEGIVTAFNKGNRKHTIQFPSGEKETYELSLHKNKIEPQYYYPNNKVLVYISEFAKHGDLYKWLEKTKPGLTNFNLILFQLFFTYAAIQTQDPSYRHNDLSLPNILVQEITIPDGYQKHFYHYQFKDTHFLIQVTNFSLRMWDMDFSNSNNIQNRKVFCGPSQDRPEYNLTDRQECGRDINMFETHGIIREPCLQYDLNFLFTWLRLYSEYYRTIPEGDLKDFVRSWSSPSVLNDVIPSYEIVQNNRLTSKIQERLLKELPLTSGTSSMTDCEQLYRQVTNEYDKIHQQPPYNRRKAKEDFLQTNPVLWTRCKYQGKKWKIPYCDFTAAHCLKHCDLFSKYSVTDAELLEKRQANLILADYVVS